MMRKVFGLTLLVAGTLALMGCEDSVTPPTELELELARAKAANDKYSTVAAAEADGFIDIQITRPNMGFHFALVSRIDGIFDPAQPEILVYNTLTPGGTPELVALEYAVPFTASENAPAGFSGSDDVWVRDEAGGVWVVHAWLWADNSAGVFTATNASVP